MSLFQQLLTEENANSRFIYLLTNIAVIISVLALVGASIWKGIGTSPSQHIVLDAFIFLVGVLLSGGVGGAAGRWLTTRKSTLVPPIESSETTRTTVEKKVSAKGAKPKS